MRIDCGYCAAQFSRSILDIGWYRPESKKFLHYPNNPIMKNQQFQPVSRSSNASRNSFPPGHPSSKAHAAWFIRLCKERVPSNGYPPQFEKTPALSIDGS